VTTTPPAGTISIAGKTVSRLGFGTMRLTGPGIWGHPDDHETATAVLRQAVETHGFSHIDTADAYGPHTCETLVRHALYPYPEHVLIATKVGLLRTGPDQWVPHGHPDYLRACVEASLRRLGVERLDLCYLHRIDREIPADDQFGVMKALQDEGKIAHIGLSKAIPGDILDAGRHFEVAAVQNVLNVIDHYDPSLETCGQLGIPYVAYRPLGAGALVKTRGVAESLAWLLDKGPHIAPIPSTSSLQHLTEIAEAVKDRT